MSILGWVLAWCGSGLNSVTVDFGAVINKELSLRYAIISSDPGMSLNCAPTRVCRKSASRPGYVVNVRTDPGYVVKQCPRIVMNKIFDWH